jgi:hypothetical protein
MEIVTCKGSNKIRRVKKLIESVGNKIGSVHFIKRSDGSLRKMSYRIHVIKPTYEKQPDGKKFAYRRAIESDNHIMTVFDTNALRYSKKGKLNGRGAYRSIPLDGVVRLKVQGVIYKFVK